MQTQPRRPASPSEPPSTEDEDIAKAGQTPPVSRWAKGLNIALAFTTLAVAFIFISRGGTFYDSLPGGRKLLFGLSVILLAGLAGGRVWLAFGWFGLRRLPGRVWGLDWVRQTVPVALLVTLALGLRVWGINFGLPYLEHVDEWNVAERALNMVRTGSLDPHDYQHPGLRVDDRQAFTYPTFYTYLEAGVFSAKFLQGVSAGKYDGTSMLEQPLIKADFYLWGRALSAILGAGTVLLLYIISRRAYGQAVGLVAALFLTFFYLHARNSQWLTTDVPSGFMALLPFLWLGYILQGRDERKFYLLAGLSAGLAVATKYNNALIALPLLLAHFMGRPRSRWLGWNLPAAFGAMLGGFILGAPFILWHFPQFLNDMAAIVNHYQNIGHAGFESDRNWWEYWRYMLLDNAEIVWLSLAGIVLAFARHRKTDIWLLAFPLFTYLQLASYKVSFSRNLMPIIPFLALFAALALVTLVQAAASWLGTRRNLSPVYANLALGGLALACVISPALTILRYDSYNAQPTNRARATAWIEQNLPHGAKIWLEPLATDLLPRDKFRLEGGKGVLANSPDWYAANGFHYIVLSEAHHKEARESGNATVKASYAALIDGPQPAGITTVQDFPRNQTDRPGTRIIVLQTGLPLVVTADYVAKNAQSANVEYAGLLKLVGVQLPANLKAGTTFSLNLYWQALKPIAQNFTTFVHVLDAKNNIVAQIDLPPFAETRATSSWKPGELLRDDYPLSLPGNLPAGSYRVSVGLYLPGGGRLALPNGQTQADIATIQVKP